MFICSNHENSRNVSLGSKSDEVNYKQLKVLSLNVCGLRSKINIPDFLEYMSDFDILCFTETKIDAYDEIIIPGFELLPPLIREKCKRKSGGISVFVKNYIHKFVNVIDNSSQCLYLFTVDKKLMYHDTLFGVLYIPPENSVYGSVDLFDDIVNKLVDVTVNNNYQVCLLGDFNAHTRTCEDYIVIDNTILDTLMIDEDSRHLMKI